VFQSSLIDSLRSLAGMILRVTVGEAEVEMAGRADERHQLLFLTLGLVTPVGEHLLLWL
jgi:hypothetical protein